LTILTRTPAETEALGERIGSVLAPGSVVALRGGLAAGKTTLTKGIARSLGVAEDVTSPTYTLISEYPGRIPLYHMDAYRLEGEEDFLALGAEEYLYGDGVCVVEWSERVASALPEGAAVVALSAMSDGARRIDIDSPLLEEQLR
jgi:tRNA threonylcarbamoyladenosine biosynthesis protein TsaE